jgi:hypothetical protein
LVEDHLSALVSAYSRCDVLLDGKRRGSTCRQNDVVTVVQVAVGGGGLNPLDPLTVPVVLELGQAGWAGDRGDPRFFVVG